MRKIMANWFSARILLAGFILLLAILLIVLVAGNLRRDPADMILDIVRPDSDLALRKLNYTETQDGQRKWSVQADSATHDLQGQIATIENIRMVIYGQERGDITVSSSHGEFDLENSLVALRGEVTLRNNDGRAIYTDELEFDSNNNLLWSDKGVRIVSGQMQLDGVGMRYDLDLGILKLRSSVEAVFQGGAIKLP